MDDIFQEEIAQGWLRIYMDDAIIATEDDEEEHTRKVDLLRADFAYDA